MVPGTNILKLYYSINGQDIDVTIIPSMLERKAIHNSRFEKFKN